MRSLHVQSIAFRHALPAFALGVLGCTSFLACGSTSSESQQLTDPATPDLTGQSPLPEQDDAAAPGPDAGAQLTAQPTAATPDASVDARAESGDGAVASEAGEAGAKGGLPAGWLYTKASKIYVSDGNGGGSGWMGRGVNMDDIFFCGYNGSLSMSAPDTALEAIASSVVSGWKANFFRVSLAMNSDTVTTSWLTNPAQYKTPMTNVINAIGANPNTYVLVTLRSDASMILYDTSGADKEATGAPSDSTNTPDPTRFPTGTDATYVALVDTFANSKFVMFGLTNEPGGSTQPVDAVAAALTHAVGTIRAEEDRLGVPHHLVAVQGNGWGGNLSYYADNPLPYDNLVYEVHGYPPPASAYTYSNIPVIIGEYGSLAGGSQDAFYADLEQKQIPNLAWDLDPYSNCAPDLLNVNGSYTDLQPSAWGSMVQSYLAAHATP
jgi:Cellulase (glycosyl hydrolase family 5)